MDALRAKSRLPIAFAQADWARAAYLAEQALAGDAGDAEVHFMLGVASAEMYQVEQAARALAEACRLAPGRADYLAHYARALLLARRFPEARAAAERSTALGPTDPSSLAMLGVTCLELNAIEPALAILRSAVRAAPDRAPLHFLLAQAETGVGNEPAAQAALETCIRLQPTFWAAHLRLARLRRQTPETQHFERLRALLASHANEPRARMFLNLALAKEHEDLHEYSAAFDCYVLGKTAARADCPPSAARDAAMFDALRRCFPEGSVPQARTDSAAPIFIFGMPRTGTTLLDRMLSNHPDVASAGELQLFPALLQGASDSHTNLLAQPNIAAHVHGVDWRALGVRYLAAAPPAAQSAPRFIDKLPHNFLYAGFIARALPGARMLCLRRDPLDTCVSNFRQLFERGSGYYDYSLDLLDTGRYYAGFDRLITHWLRVLPGHLLEVRYEDLVRIPEATLQRVLAFCGLPWNDAVLHPEMNRAPVHTPSAWQVRHALYRDAIGSWRHYEQQLQPLRELLGSAGVALSA